MTCSTVKHFLHVLDTLRCASERHCPAERSLFDIFVIPVSEHPGANDKWSSSWRFKKFSATNRILALLPQEPVAELLSTHDIEIVCLMLVTTWVSFIEWAVLSQAHGEDSGFDLFLVLRASPDVRGLNNPGKVPQSRGLPQKEGSNGRLSRSRDTRYGTRGPGSRADRNANTSRHGLLAGDDGASHRRRPSS